MFLLLMTMSGRKSLDIGMSQPGGIGEERLADKDRLAASLS